MEISFYLNLNFTFKIEATCSIARIIKSGCNLIARKRLASTEILSRTSRSRTEQYIYKPLYNFEFLCLSNTETKAPSYMNTRD